MSGGGNESRRPPLAAVAVNIWQRFQMPAPTAINCALAPTASHPAYHRQFRLALQAARARPGAATRSDGHSPQFAVNIWQRFQMPAPTYDADRICRVSMASASGLGTSGGRCGCILGMRHQRSGGSPGVRCSMSQLLRTKRHTATGKQSQVLVANREPPHARHTCLRQSTAHQGCVLRHGVVLMPRSAGDACATPRRNHPPVDA